MSKKKLSKKAKKILARIEQESHEANDRIQDNTIIQARKPRRPKNLSKQDDTNDRTFSSVYRWITDPELTEVPYTADSSKRDAWLRTLYHKEPHLAGVIASVNAIDKNRAWRLVGPEKLVSQYNRTLRMANDGSGWRHYMAQQSLAYYTSDLGAITEIGRSSAAGPLRALYHVDPVKCQLTGDRDTPLEYDGDPWYWYDYFASTSVISTNEDLNGLGYCAVSRAYELARLMIAVYQHDQEQLGARAPRGLLLLKNITQEQWEEAMAAREAALDSKMQRWFGGVAVLAQLGFDTVDAKLIGLSQLPDNFNLRDFTDLLMYGYALCFGYDPVEFWPVQSGALGRGREAEVQHLKATGKGGADLMLTYQDQLQLQLPESLLFEFEHRDPEGMMLEAEIALTWAKTADLLYQAGLGVLTREQAASLLANHAVIPDTWTEATEETTKSAESNLGDDVVDPSATSSGGQPDTTPVESSPAYPDAIEQYLDTSAYVRQSLIDFPDQPIVQYSWPSHTTKLLWHPDPNYPQPLNRRRTIHDLNPTASNLPRVQSAIPIDPRSNIGTDDRLTQANLFDSIGQGDSSGHSNGVHTPMPVLQVE